MKESTEIKLEHIRIDGGTQARVSINKLVVADYSDAMTDGAILPPVTLFFDGAEYWLADGFHRYHAHCKIGALNVDAEVRNGTPADAKLFAYGANKDHGLRRTNEDKRKAVDGMLADFGSLSDREIARHVGVDHKTVAAGRERLTGEFPSENPTDRTYTTKHGTTATMQTSKIGKAKPATPSPDSATRPEETPPAPDIAVDPDMPADMEGYDLSQDVTSDTDLLASERQENAILQAQVDAFQEVDRDAELEKQIRIRFGIEQRLHQEMDKVAQLSKELRYMGKQFAELRKMTKADSNADVMVAVRALLKEAA